MLLRAPFVLLAMKLQEAATSVSMEEIRTRISACLREHFEEMGTYGWLVDVLGDDKSGKCVFSCSDGFMQADYKLRTTDNKATCTIDFEGAIGVVPHTTYKATEAAVPGAADDGVSRETSLSLIESAETLEPIVLRESRADYEIKLIAPGKGATAFYPAEVLKRDGPKVFTKETHVYLNHPTAAEESQRPEGDVKNLAGVLTSDAVFHESHPKGPGLYARMKVFADHAQLVEEKAAHVGMSIRASGVREAGAMREGLPVLKQLVAAESVDVVTRAGAGGMILTESLKRHLDGTDITDLTEAAKPQIQTQEAAMDAAELTKLQESIAAQAKVNAALLERALRGDAREEAQRILVGVTLQEASKARVVEAALRTIPKTEAGELDKAKFTEIVNQEAKREGEYVASLTGSGRVTGMGSAPVQQTPEERQRAQEAAKVSIEDAIKVYEGLGLPRAAAEAAANSYGEAA